MEPNPYESPRFSANKSPLRDHRAAIIVACLSFVAYVGGYFVFNEETSAYRGKDTRRIRFFDSEWLERLYSPAVKAEAFITGWDVTSRQASSRNRSSPN